MVEDGSTAMATGRRKSSVARVWLHRGTGVVKINSREIENFFPVERHRAAVLAPLKATKTLGKFDVVADVSGGGLSGQAEAIMLGVARALRRVSSDLDPALRESGLLTRDSRMKERKKYGRRAARRSFQFSKR
jgi:small subunit ribosomal protein S9